MRRREFVMLLGASAIPFPRQAGTQQSIKDTESPLVGFLGLTSPQEFAQEVAAFHHGLAERNLEPGVQTLGIVGRHQTVFC